MQYSLWYTASVLFTATYAQTTSLALQQNRVSMDCPPSLNFCSRTEWRDCAPPITSWNYCVPADRLNEVASIAIDLGLCCRFYSDDKCRIAVDGWGSKAAWYPGNTSLELDWKSAVGSYACKQTNVLEGCPGLAGTSFTASVSVARASPSQYTA